MPLLGVDDGDVELLGPGFELLDRRGTEGVGGSEHDGFAFALVALGQLGDGRRLSGAVDADDQLDEGFFAFGLDLLHVVDEEGDEGVVELYAFHLLGKGVDDLFDQVVGDVRLEQEIFEFVTLDRLPLDGSVAFDRLDGFLQTFFEEAEHYFATFLSASLMSLSSISSGTMPT